MNTKDYMKADHDSKKSPVFLITKPKLSTITKRMQWIKNYDEYLIHLVKDFKLENWTEISKEMFKRFPETDFNGRKCRSRWKNSINPELNKLYLNDAEELILIAYHSQYKNLWQEISHKFLHRSNNCLRNSLYGIIKKIVNKFEMGKPEIEIDPLTFLQYLYTSIIILETMDLTEVPSHKSNLIPLYMYQYIKKSQVTKENCKEFINRCKEVLIKSHPDRKILRKLIESSYESLTQEFFKNIISIIIEKIKVTTTITSSLLLDMFESALTPKVMSSIPSSDRKASPLLPPIDVILKNIDGIKKLPIVNQVQITNPILSLKCSRVCITLTSTK